MKRLLGLLIPLSLLAGCGDEPTQVPDVDAAPAIDAALAIDAAVDAAPVLDPALLGRWRELPNAASTRPPEPVGERTTYVFMADGTMTLGHFDEQQPGRANWRIEGGLLAIVTPFGVGAGPYRVTADRLGVDVLTPVGTADGMVGTWTMVSFSDGVPETGTIVINADGTATVTDYRITTGTASGTWQAVGDDVEILAPSTFPLAQLSLMNGELVRPFELVP